MLVRVGVLVSDIRRARGLDDHRDVSYSRERAISLLVHLHLTSAGLGGEELRHLRWWSYCGRSRKGRRGKCHMGYGVSRFDRFTHLGQTGSHYVLLYEYVVLQSMLLLDIFQGRSTRVLHDLRKI